MEEELKEAIGIVEEMLEETKIKNIKILLPVEERAIENILNRLEQDERVINKAIEYIERNARKCGNGEEWFESSYCCTSLLNILKENKKEV